MRLLLSFILVIAFNSGFSQKTSSSNRPVSASYYQQTSYTVNDGLLGKIHSIAVDESGMVYISCDGGLQRFDGSSFEELIPPKMANEANEIRIMDTCIYLISDVVFSYNLKQNTYRQIPLQNSITDLKFTMIFKGENNYNNTYSSINSGQKLQVDDQNQIWYHSDSIPTYYNASSKEHFNAIIEGAIESHPIFSHSNIVFTLEDNNFIFLKNRFIQDNEFGIWLQPEGEDFVIRYYEGQYSHYKYPGVLSNVYATTTNKFIFLDLIQPDQLLIIDRATRKSSVHTNEEHDVIQFSNMEIMEDPKDAGVLYFFSDSSIVQFKNNEFHHFPIPSKGKDFFGLRFVPNTEKVLFATNTILFQFHPNKKVIPIVYQDEQNENGNIRIGNITPGYNHDYWTSIGAELVHITPSELSRTYFPSPSKNYLIGENELLHISNYPKVKNDEYTYRNGKLVLLKPMETLAGIQKANLYHNSSVTTVESFNIGKYHHFGRSSFLQTERAIYAIKNGEYDQIYQWKFPVRERKMEQIVPFEIDNKVYFRILKEKFRGLGFIDVEKGMEHYESWDSTLAQFNRSLENKEQINHDFPIHVLGKNRLMVNGASFDDAYQKTSYQPMVFDINKKTITRVSVKYRNKKKRLAILGDNQGGCFAVFSDSIFYFDSLNTSYVSPSLFPYHNSIKPFALENKVFLVDINGICHQLSHANGKIIQEQLDNNNFFGSIQDIKTWGNKIWINSRKGLFECQINQNNLESKLLVDKVKHGIIQGRLFVSQDGEPYLQLDDMIIRIKPSKENELDYKAPWFVYLEASEYNLGKINEYAKLAFDENHLQFKFKGLETSSPDSLFYSYRLVGLTDEWSSRKNITEVEYQSLASGKYTFEIRLHGIKNTLSDIYQFEFQIFPPYYQTWWFRILIIGTSLFIGYSLYRLRTKRLRKKHIQLEYKIKERTEEVVKQKEEIEEQHKEIKDSINYAKRIQNAILPPAKLVKEYLKKSFILYKPKDVVAGDFYWMNHVNNDVLFAAADCTGHGVPGAMVSVVCNGALNRSIREYSLSDPGEILTKTREIVIAEFEKSDDEVKDGMDIALCSLQGTKLKYAGAHNPLWIIRKGSLVVQEIKANKQPIGKFDHQLPYTTHTIELEEGDTIYIFSDGYVDQFGGEKGKKFKSKAFRELLLSIQDKSMEEQRLLIDEAFESWRGNLEQIDDVCVIGVRI